MPHHSSEGRRPTNWSRSCNVKHSNIKSLVIQPAFEEFVSPIPSPIESLRKFLNYVAHPKKKRRRKSKQTRTRKLNGFMAFKSYYSQFNQSQLRMLEFNKKLYTIWQSYEHRGIWERYARQYNLRERNVTFLQWLEFVPKVRGECHFVNRSSPQITLTCTQQLPRSQYSPIGTDLSKSRMCKIEFELQPKREIKQEEFEYPSNINQPRQYGRRIRPVAARKTGHYRWLYGIPYLKKDLSTTDIFYSSLWHWGDL